MEGFTIENLKIWKPLASLTPLLHCLIYCFTHFLHRTPRPIHSPVSLPASLTPLYPLLIPSRLLASHTSFLTVLPLLLPSSLILSITLTHSLLTRCLPHTPASLTVSLIFFLIHFFATNICYIPLHHSSSLTPLTLPTHSLLTPLPHLFLIHSLSHSFPSPFTPLLHSPSLTPFLTYSPA